MWTATQPRNVKNCNRNDDDDDDEEKTPQSVSEGVAQHFHRIKSLLALQPCFFYRSSPKCATAPLHKHFLVSSQLTMSHFLQIETISSAAAANHIRWQHEPHLPPAVTTSAASVSCRTSDLNAIKQLLRRVIFQIRFRHSPKPSWGVCVKDTARGLWMAVCSPEALLIIRSPQRRRGKVNEFCIGP